MRLDIIYFGKTGGLKNYITDRCMIREISRSRLFFTVALLFTFPFCGAQITKPELIIESEAHFSTSTTAPFYFINNQEGIYHQSGSNLYTGLGLKGKPTPDTSFFSVQYGLKGAYAALNDSNNLWLHEAYIGINLFMVEVMGGWFNRFEGNGDSLLGSGYIVNAQNTRPMPKVSIGSRGWYSIPFTYDLIEVKGLMEHGWFQDKRFVENVLLHHKNFYVKLGGDFWLNISGGLDHYALWGGISPIDTIGKQPSDLAAFKDIFFAEHADTTDPDLIWQERFNRMGNHLGSWNFRVDFNFPNIELALYYQSVFEDKSGFKRKINKDGLWGLMVKPLQVMFIDRLVAELILTSYQSGNRHVFGKQVGMDNYFNNYLYRNGWSYYRNTIGNPLITSPHYFGDGNVRFLNNRVEAGYIGVTGHFREINYLFHGVYSHNLGLHGGGKYEPKKKQLSLMFELSKSLNQLHTISARLGVDRGDMYPNTIGLGIGYNYNFRF